MQNWMESLFEKLKEKETLLFTVIFTILVSFRVWLMAGIPKMLIYGPHDDLFFAKAAHFIIHRQWMGPYDQMTLIKEPFYPIFMVISFITGLPLYLNETIFYVGACIVLFYAFVPLIENRWSRLLSFTLLLFVPASLSESMTIGVRRDFVYLSLTLYVIAFSIGLILRLSKKISMLLPWSVGLGISVGAFMITREEGVWIYPILLLLLTGSLLLIWLGNADQKLMRLLLIILPILVWQIPSLVVSYLNYSYYGFWGTAETLDPDFNRVINTLDRIETDGVWHPAIQIPQEARMKAYEVSPLLSAIKDPIENPVINWKDFDEGAMALKPEWYLNKYGNGGNEISNGHFIWLFRDAVASGGYYSNGKYPRDFYSQLADQLEAACNSGSLKCTSPKNIPFIGAVDYRHYPIILRMFYEGFFQILRLDYVRMVSLDIRTWPRWPEGDDQSVGYLEEFAYNSLNGPGIHPGNDAAYVVNGKVDIRLRMLQSKEIIMRGIFNAYKMPTLSFFVISLAVWIILVVMSILSRKWRESQGTFLIISSLALGLLFSRMMTLAIVDATTSVSGFIYYGASNYLFIYIFIFIMLYWALDQLIGIILGRQVEKNNVFIAGGAVEGVILTIVNLYERAKNSLAHRKTQ